MNAHEKGNNKDKELLSTGSVQNTQLLATKTLEDINFLRSRIERIKKLKSPNSSILKTYESMLASRISVLEWLIKQGAEIEEQEYPRKKAI